DAGGGGDFKNFRARVFLEHKSGKKFPAVIFAGGGGKEISFVKQGGKAYRVKTALIGPNLPVSPASLMVEKKKPKN
ncbi:MAG: hypothetical protein V3V56_11085, partial [bacterium]